MEEAPSGLRAVFGDTGPAPRTAADVMTVPAISVAPGTSVGDVARLLLERGISAVPVVDGSGNPIGMASERDLLGRGEGDRAAGRGWRLAALAGGDPGPTSLGEGAAMRPVEDVMHAPVVTVDAAAPVRAVAEMLRSHRIKRLPVMRDGRMVGIVGRADLLRVVEDMRGPAEAPPRPGGGLLDLLMGLVGGPGRGSEIVPAAPSVPIAAGPPPSAGPITADGLRGLAASARKAELDEKEAAARAAELERRREVEDMLRRHVGEAAWETMIAHARAAAARGARECELLRFPSDLCSDGGRRIDVGEEGWPGTLRGEAADLYDRWERRLRPVGLGLDARIVSYPHGMPGDVGLFLTWGG